MRGLRAAALGLAARGLDAVSERSADAARTARFLRERRDFEPRPDDVFVSSYPRSGTTWMQVVLHHLLGDGQMEFAHISEAQPWFERSLAHGTQTAVSLAARPGPRVFKSHLPRAWLPRLGRFVYVERAVEDVLVSYFHFYRSHLAYEGSFEEFFERFVQGKLQYGSWARHVAGWRALEQDAAVLLVRYEDLLADREGQIERLAKFLGVPDATRTVARAVQASGFEAMKAHESKLDPITEHLLDRGHVPAQFLRSGRGGEGRTRLSEAQREQLRGARAPGRPRRLSVELPAFLH